MRSTPTPHCSPNLSVHLTLPHRIHPTLQPTLLVNPHVYGDAIKFALQLVWVVALTVRSLSSPFPPSPIHPLLPSLRSDSHSSFPETSTVAPIMPDDRRQAERGSRTCLGKSADQLGECPCAAAAGLATDNTCYLLLLLLLLLTIKWRIMQRICRVTFRPWTGETKAACALSRCRSPFRVFNET